MAPGAGGAEAEEGARGREGRGKRREGAMATRERESLTSQYCAMLLVVGMKCGREIARAYRERTTM